MKKPLSYVLTFMLVLAQSPASRAARQTPATPPLPQPAPQQEPSPTPPEDADDNDVVRITTNLIQFDAVVTDKQGRLVTDLRPEDFEVSVDGRRQELTHVSFVSNESGTAGGGRPPAARDRGAPPPRPDRLSAGQVRRTIALVVDDLGTSFRSLVSVRRALRKFVDEQMQPGDLVAVIQTGKGMGVLQQFTTDRQLLHRAIDGVRWNPSGRGNIDDFEPINDDPMGQFTGDLPQRAGGMDESNEPGFESFRADVSIGGTLSALDFTVRGMKELPGRKSVIFFSGSLPILDRGDLAVSSHLREKVRQLADAANRASVVVNTVDARRLPYTGLTAADQVNPGRDPIRLAGIMTSRNIQFQDLQSGLSYLAEQTGGLFIRNTNDLGGGVERILEDQKGYYLIAIRPDEAVFERVQGGARFNNLEVKVRRAGLRVRTRAGFYGVTEGEVAAASASRGSARTQSILAALASPFSAGDLPLRMTSLFSSPAQKTAALDSLVHIDVSRLKFTDEPDGWKKAVIDVVALTFGEGERIIDEVNRTETLRARGEAFDDIIRNGVIYLMKVPVNKPGAYQLRVVVRDMANARIGSASQFVEVPDLAANRLALSGLFVTAAPQAKAAAAALSESDLLRNATLRRFRYGSQLDFSYHIYNARAEGATGVPRLRTQVRLFRDGRPVFNAPAQAYDPGRQTNAARLQAGGRLQLGGSLQPGEYSLQVVVTDDLVKGKRGTATQWIDFEIVK